MASRRYRTLRRTLRRKDRRQLLALAMAALALVMLVHTGSHSHPSSSAAPAQASVASAPSGSSYTPASWAQAFLAMISEPQTACNEAAVTAWEIAEGGNWTNAAQYNPLDTTQPESGSWPVPGNPDKVQAYPNWREGFQANATAITNGLYEPVLSALSAGNNAQSVANAVTASPWGTGRFQASC
jgi:hypothetical protein